jgi:hypothetical protein
MPRRGGRSQANRPEPVAIHAGNILKTSPGDPSDSEHHLTRPDFRTRRWRRFTRSSAETWCTFVPGSKFTTADGVFQVREDEPAPLSTLRRQPWDPHCAIGILCRPAPFSRMLYVPAEPADPATPSSFRSRPGLFFLCQTAALCSSLSTTWRRAFHPALRYGRPSCAGKSRRRHGSGEPPCMRRRFPAASCRSPGQGPDR